MGRIPVCPQHKCHPSDCFDIHYPESTRSGGAPSEEEIRLEILNRHITRQNENIRLEQEKMSRNIEDLDEYRARRREGA